MPDTLLPNITQFLMRIDPFDQLPQALCEKIARQIEIVYYSANETIADLSVTEKSLYIICKGSIEQREDDGTLRARLGREDMFGFTLINSENADVLPYRSIALTSTLLYVVPYRAIVDVLEAYPQYAALFAKQAEKRLDSALKVVWSDKDKGLFVKSVAEVASSKVAIVDVSTSIQDVAIEMHQVSRAPCAVVLQDGNIVGLITDRDMTRRVVARNFDVNLPVSEVMTKNPLTVQPDSLVLEAVSLMMSNDVRNLPIVEEGKVTGLLTTSDLVHNHRMQAVFLIQKVRYAKSLLELTSLQNERRAIFEALVEGGVSPSSTGQVMSLIMDAFTKRLIQLFIEEHGNAPCQFSWMVAGSHARNELHLLSDQDNALILSDEVKEHELPYFDSLAKYVCEGLDLCGYPLCSGNYMATNKRWCQPVSMWEHYYRKWTKNPEYERLLNITVFLEVRSVFGEADYVDQLRACLHTNISNNREFLLMLVREATKTQPPLGIFNKLVLEKTGSNAKTLNIKKFAINLIIDLARIYGLMAHCESSGTEARFKAALAKGVISEGAYKDIMSAFRFIQSYRLSHQLHCLKSGLELNNNIDPDVFGSFERKHLKDAFRLISQLQSLVKLRVGVR